MNVLSLFDGLSCGQMALERAGIKVDKYYASEIKPHAIKVTQHNYPNTIQLGDVTKVTKDMVSDVKLLIGGSPCQDLSAGNRERLGLAGLKSSLFYQYLRILEEVKPQFFLLENVIMDWEHSMTITNLLKTRPCRINSSLLSAQLRDRLYWTNIGPEDFDLFGNRECTIPQPEDKGITLQSILESGWTDMPKSRCLLESDSRPLANPYNMFHRYYSTGFTTVVFKDEATFEEMKAAYKKTLDEDGNRSLPYDLEVFAKGRIRYLSQTELEKLQTVPQNYTSILNRNDAACLLGDGWTCDVISHIFSFLPEEYKKR